MTEPKTELIAAAEQFVRDELKGQDGVSLERGKISQQKKEKKKNAKNLGALSIFVLDILDQ
jgi:hypothetical protein